MVVSSGTSPSTLSTREFFALQMTAFRLIRIRSAITHGISHVVGDVAVGKMADLVLWKPEYFGAKPEMVLKSGVIAWAQVRYRARDHPFCQLKRWYSGWRSEWRYSNRSALVLKADVGR